MFLKKFSTEYSGVLYALYAAMVLSAIFLVFRYLEATSQVWLRVIDVLVLYYFSGKVIEYFRIHHQGITYFQSFGVSVLTCSLSMLFFSMFLFVYFMFIDPSYMEYLVRTAPMGEHLNPYIISATLIIEGIAIGFIVSLIKVNALKRIKE